MKKAKRLEQTKEYYFSRKLREIRLLQKQGKQIINLAIGNPDLPPDIKVRQQAAKQILEHDTHGYQPYKGIAELREKMAHWYKTVYNVELNHETEIIPLAGSKEGIFYISMAYLNPADQVLVPDVGYPAYAATAKLLGAEPVFYDLTKENQWMPDFEQLQRMDLSKVKIMWLNYPNMPTGTAASRELFEKAVQFGLRNNILICNDNPYSLILSKEPTSILQVKNAKKTAVELNSLSKTYNMAGWRIGLLAGSQNLIEPAFTILTNIQSGMFLPIQKAAIEALNLGAEWMEKQNAIYTRRREIVFEILDALNCKYEKNGQGLFVWAELPNNTDSYKFTDYLLEKYGIFVAPGAIFGKNGHNFIRISLCQNEKTLTKALQLIKN